MMNTYSLKARIFVCITPLAICVAAASGYLIYESYLSETRAFELRRSAEYSSIMSQSIHGIQKERGVSSLFLNSKTTQADLEAKRETLNKQISELKVINTKLDPLTQKGTEEALQELESIRKHVNDKVQAQESNREFGSLVSKMIRLQVSRAKSSPYNGLEGRLVSQSIFETAKENMGRLRASTNAILASDAATDNATLTQLEAYKLGITSNLESPALMVSNKTRSSVQLMLESQTWQEILRVLEKIHARQATGKYEEDSKKFSENITSVIDQVYGLVDTETSEILASATSAYNNARSMFWLTILASSLILSCVFGLASTIVGKITSSLTTLSNDVATGANLTNSAAQDLATASEALSSGVTEQAASLQETVSSLEEVSAMIKKNADNANGLKSAADSGVQSSQQCESEVKGMMQAMSDIRSSSDAINLQIEANNQSLNEITTVIKQIAEKTKVINDIVFQTKLLSFNASVEAARAGEHGKGFAVVAEEIGNLATMSGGAAQEISSLLESGVNQVNEVINQSQANIGTLTGKSKEDVEAGFARAQACQGALENALAKIKEINEMAGSIATACAEQSQGVGEISVAMNQLDQVTQGNSGSATQVAAVADRLKVQSHKLTQSVRTLSGIVHGGRSKPSTNQLIAETVNFSNANQT